jgi:hypothetical protein
VDRRCGDSIGQTWKDVAAGSATLAKKDRAPPHPVFLPRVKRRRENDLRSFFTCDR